jgi:hypothetical protein
VSSFDADSLSGVTGLMSEMYRISLYYSGDSGNKDLPKTLIVKFSSINFGQRFVAAWLSFYASEVGFYNNLITRYDTGDNLLTMPKSYYAAVDSTGARCILLMEDLAPRGTACDQLTGCSMAQAETAFRAMAKFHATFMTPPGEQLPSSADFVLHWDAPVYRNSMAMYKSCIPIWIEKFNPPAAAIEMVKLLGENRPALAKAMADSNETIVHGDFRLDNIIFNGDENTCDGMLVYDFQVVKREFGEYDLAYFLTCGGAEKIRETNESDLLQLYHKELSARLPEANRPSMEMVWRNYLAGIVLIAPTIVTGAKFIKSEDERGTKILEGMNTGFCNAVVAHDLTSFLSDIVAGKGVDPERKAGWQQASEKDPLIA